jgi:class 3 adenylate cyclase
MFADLRGYTQFVERRGAAEAVELLYAYLQIVREVIALHHGADQRLEKPAARLTGIWFFAGRDAGVAISEIRRPQRIRRPKSDPSNPPIAA